MTSDVGTILLAHGSPTPGQDAVILDLANKAQQVTGDPWRAAFLDHHGPDLSHAARELQTVGAQRLVVVPTLLSQAFHALSDVPAAVASWRGALPIAVAEPLGPDPLLFDTIGAHLSAWSAEHGVNARDVTVVVASAGTSDAKARQRFIDAVEREGLRTGAARAIPAFIAGGDPDVTTAVADACAESPMTVFAAFTLAEGVLSRRGQVAAHAAGAAGSLPVFGAADEVVAILVDRRDACVMV